MKAKFALLLSAVSAALAIPAQQMVLPANGLRQALAEAAESKLSLPMEWPGIDLDLNELRLIQLEDAIDPVWMTELEKVCVSPNPFVTCILTFV